MSTDNPESPFVPGARVAIIGDNGWRRLRYREGFVDKVYKTGRFTLRGSSQQWRPWKPSNSVLGSDYWTATATGDRGFGDHGRLRIWDAAADAEISAVIAEGERERRIKDIARRFERLDPSKIDEAALDVIEAALAGKPEV